MEASVILTSAKDKYEREMFFVILGSMSELIGYWGTFLSEY